MIKRFVAVAALGLAACANLTGPRTLTVSPGQIEQALTRQLPLERAYGDLVDVRVRHPVVRLLPDENRIAAAFDIRVTPRLLGRSYDGHLALDSALRFEPQDGTLRLSNPRIRQLDVAGWAGGDAAVLQRLGSFVIEELLHDAPVYRLAPGDLTYAGVRYLPGDLRVTPAGLAVTLVPQAAP